MVTAYGPKVIDFGIARPEHGLTLTTTGQTPVTPGYGAPEQVLVRRVVRSRTPNITGSRPTRHRVFVMNDSSLTVLPVF